MHKKAFSFVELIIVITILALLGIVAYSVNNSVKQKTINTRVTADLGTIKNSLSSYLSDEGMVPLPAGNLNNFNADSSYSHNGIDIEAEKGPKAFGTFGKITKNTLPNSYLSSEVQDSRTGNYYSYGVTADRTSFEVAGVVAKEDYFVAALAGNYRGDGGPYSLIREYNGPKFVQDGEATLPYNPYEQVVTVTDSSGKLYQQGETVGPFTNDMPLYFSDGTVSVLTKDSYFILEKAEYAKDNSLITNIELALNAGTLWTKASRLFSSESETSSFQVSTSDTTAAVRGTIFCISKYDEFLKDYEGCNTKATTNVVNQGSSEIVLVEGELEVGVGTTPAKENPTLVIPVVFPDEEENTKKDNTVTLDPVPTEDEIEQQIEDSTEKTATTDEEETVEVNPDNCVQTPDGQECGTLEGYTLVAYAPYNTSGDINMYTKGDSITVTQDKVIWKETNLWLYPMDMESRLKKSDPDLDVTCENANSFCTVDGTTSGIVLDNKFTDDFVRYENLNNLDLQDDFAIEMRVRIGENQRTGGPYYLFDMEDKLELYLEGGEIKISSNGKEELNEDTSYIGKNNFHTFMIKVQYNKATLLIDGQQIGGQINIDTANLLIVGANYGFNPFNQTIGYGDQINNIIDYVKIYK